MEAPVLKNVVRLLYVFEPKAKVTGSQEWRTALGGVRLSDTAVWPVQESEPAPSYLDELLSPVAALLFGTVGKGQRPAGDWGFEYRQAAPVLNDHLKDLELRPGSGKAEKPEATFRLASDLRAEVWLSHQGVGVLSLAFEVLEPDLEVIQQFVYRISELGRHRGVKIRRALSDHPSAPPAPEATAPMADRIGKRGGEFTSAELLEFLLPDLVDTTSLSKPHHFVAVRLGEAVDFSKGANPILERRLFGIAQGEECAHAGYNPGVDAPPALTLNVKHRVANSTYGSAHFVADQADTGFNEERLHRIVTKYFVLYLTTLLQRALFERPLAEVSALLARQGDLTQLRGDRTSEVSKALYSLQLRVAQITSTELFALASSRDVLQRYYCLCQESNLVEEARSDAERSIADIQGLLREAQSLATLQELAALSHIAHRFELVVLGVYAIEAAHILLEPVQARHWLELGFFLALGAAGVFLGLTLQRMRHHGHHQAEPGLARMFGVLATVVLLGGVVLAVILMTGGAR
jgi:hypothetical protein